jgi:chemotaxis protein methyltransferase CheR
LATDIDTKVLQLAQNSVYHRERMDEIPHELHESNVNIGRRGLEDWFRISPSTRENITFRQFNLSNLPYPPDFSPDVIFCRNVLIYFKVEMVQAVLAELYERARVGALLCIGQTESLNTLRENPWISVGDSIFTKPGPA